MNKAVLKMSDFVGQGYDEFWKFKGRYRIVKGSRASKKSKTASLWFISNLSKEKYKQANLLVIRKTWNEHHWIKKRFFDAEPDPDILAMTTNYLCNEWLGKG